MSRKCFLTGKGPKVINNVSHANNRTKKRQLPNLQVIRVFDPESGTYRRRRVTTRAMRTLDRHGLIARAPRIVAQEDDE